MHINLLSKNKTYQIKTLNEKKSLSQIFTKKKKQVKETINIHFQFRIEHFIYSKILKFYFNKKNDFFFLLATYIAWKEESDMNEISSEMIENFIRKRKKQSPALHIKSKNISFALL